MNKPPKNSKKNPNTAVDGLPVELVLMIMSQLSLPDLLNFALVSHSMREFAYDNAIWNAFLKSEAKDFQSARAVFMASPEKRADKYIAVDQLGKDYLRSLTTSPVTQAPARSTCVGRYAYSAPYSGSYSSMFHNPSHEYMTQPQRVVEPVKPKAGR